MPRTLPGIRRATRASAPVAVAAVLVGLLSPMGAVSAAAADSGGTGGTAAAATRPVGIDVSRYQSSSTTTSCSGPVQVDWRRVRAAGRTFAFVKATGSRTSGTITQDPCFARNWAGAGSAGLFRDGSVAFEQVTPLGELTVRWTGADEGDVEVSDEFDEADDGPTASDRPAESTEPATEASTDASSDSAQSPDAPPTAPPG